MNAAAPKTTVDWLRFRTQSDPRIGLDALRPMFGDLGSTLALHSLDHGKDGFLSAAEVLLGGMAIGRVDFGGHSQRGWCRWNLSGKGCEWVQRWDNIDAIEALPDAEIRRLDIALTTWRGEVTHDRVVQAHSVGRFTVRRPPDLRQITSSNDRAGRTCYVGSRESDKFFRAYEKGFEIAGKYPNIQITHIDGFRIEDIYRCELELKATGQAIPFEVVGSRDSYFAGAYPFCADVLPGIEADILQRRPEREPVTDMAMVLENIRVQYGTALFTALTVHHGDILAVWDKIVGTKHNETLVRAGVLLVDHE